MRRRTRIALVAGGVLAALVVALFVGGVLVLRSRWFREQVRRKMVETVETATGGRAEIGRFEFSWRTLRAEVHEFTLHGSEPAGQQPLLRVASVAVGLRVISVLERKADIAYLEIRQPQINLIVAADGTTNVPQPKLKKPGGNTVETILDLAIGRFDIANGAFDVNAGGATPFDAHGRNLQSKLLYERAGKRYRGTLDVDPLDFRLFGGTRYAPLAIKLHAAVTVEKNRAEIGALDLDFGHTTVRAAGVMEDFLDPHGSFHCDLRLAFTDLGAFLKEAALRAGTAQIGGRGTFRGADFSLTGNLNAYGVEYRDSSVTMHGLSAYGAIRANPHQAEIDGLHFGGIVVTAHDAAGNESDRVPVEGLITNTVFRHNDFLFHNVDAALLGGGFQGEAEIRDFKGYTARGTVNSIGARRLLEVFGSGPVPWDARVAGTAEGQGVFGDARTLRVSAHGDITPAPKGEPVHGTATAVYDGSRRTLDLGHSTLRLPATDVDFSGVLGMVLRARLRTRDLRDLMPILGAAARAAPLALRNGEAAFDGTVAGDLDDPTLVGRITASNVVYDGRFFRSVKADVRLSPSGLTAKNGLLTGEKALTAEFQGKLALVDWGAEDDSPVSATIALRTPVAELAALTGAADFPATGTIGGTAQISGTYGSPHVNATLDAAKGTLRGEPFDSLTAKVTYSAGNVEVGAAQVRAGARQVDLQAGYTYAAETPENGRLRFQLTSNAMPLEQFRTVVKERPDARGTVQVAARGVLDLAPGQKGETDFRVAELHADVTGRGLRMGDGRLGDVHLVANTSGRELVAHLDSDFANSVVRGDGRWSLDGDYRGAASVKFAKIDLARLRAWISPVKTAGQLDVAGSAEAELSIDGPALDPEAWRASLRIPTLEISPAPDTDLAANARILALHNSGPIVISMAKSVISVQSARMVGRSTDLTIAGKIALRDNNPLNLRINGKADLAGVHDFDRNLNAHGTLITDVAVRGALDSPQVNGRVSFDDVTFNIADIPNGISKAKGVVLFDGSRATIQSFVGETGGGKVELTGFGGFANGQVVFGLEANAEHVRVRYPEGVSTVANARLKLTGTTARSMVAGSITIVRTGFNPQSDFSSLLAHSAEPVQTPSARTGFLGGLNFDVQIQTSPDVQFQSSLTQGLQLETNLRLRGTASNPALLGRVSITQGQVIFFGTKYNISQGTVAFYNPVKIDPILNIDLETKARGVDVTLTVSGPLNKLNLTPRSDPPLQFQEIVSLLATGAAPTSDPALLAQQSNQPQTWQQVGASALLGQAIANPVAGRLQRFFGVSRLKIDPTLTGVESNPQARLTLEQQVTQDIVFTYITNVTSSNPQVIRVEWDIGKRWSAVALREENGLFGLDFFYKRRFR